MAASGGRTEGCGGESESCAGPSTPEDGVPGTRNHKGEKSAEPGKSSKTIQLEAFLRGLERFFIQETMKRLELREKEGKHHE